MATMKEKLQKIADFYGYEAQSRQLVEEMAELTVALNKAWRNKEHLYFSKDDMSEARRNIIEEIADVEIMLEQIKFILDCEGDVFLEKIKKVDRQIERMNNV